MIFSGVQNLAKYHSGNYTFDLNSLGALKFIFAVLKSQKNILGKLLNAMRCYRMQ